MKNILIVDDEKFVRLGLKTMIARSDICTGEIIECKNGKEALDELNNNEFDLIISDIKMPIMTGIELISKIKEENLSNAPIIIISGYDEFEYAVSALRFGATDYLLKPIERENFLQLLQKIDNLIEDKLLKDVKVIEIDGDEKRIKSIKFNVLRTSLTKTTIKISIWLQFQTKFR